ncbi:MAG TPA: flavodoxin domain-containing protein [Kofleriaceae bacterium]|nr:flavodoxin domain-containing protein [Kofleriaceae bacterium]
MQTITASRAQRTKTLIVSADSQGYTSTVARAIGARLQSRGHDVHFGDALSGQPPAPAEYDAVIFGAEHGARVDRRALAAYIARHRELLGRIPTGLFVVNRSRSRGDARAPIEVLETSIGWRPSYAAGIDCAHLGISRTLLRRFMRFLLRRLDVSIASSSTEEIRALVAAMERAVARRR